MVGFSNEVSMGGDGWAQLAPFGDFPGSATFVNEAGKITRQHAIQRMDKTAAEAMVANFKSPLQRIKRFITGAYIYRGHPDFPGADARQYPDKVPKGLIADLQVREDGLYGLPIFNNEGSQLVESGELKYFSPRWATVPAGEQNGDPVYRPDRFISVGLTNRPNLPVRQLANEEPETMTLTAVLAALAKQGVTLAATATDAEIANAIEGIGSKVATMANDKTAAETKAGTALATITTLTTERDQLMTEFANERKAHAALLLDAAIKRGAITAADKPVWEGRLAANFANESTALAAIKPDTAIKTTSVTSQLGTRQTPAVTPAKSAGDKLTEFANERMRAKGEDWHTAYNKAVADHPDLAQQLAQPAQ